MTDEQRMWMLKLGRRHEGLRLKSYRDTKGIWTVGVGRNLESVGLSRDEVIQLLQHVTVPADLAWRWFEADLSRAELDLTTFDWWDRLNEPRQAALLDFRFNVGAGTFRTFKRTLAAIARGDYDSAASHLFASKYATDVGKKPGQRAWRVASMLRTGDWPDDV